VYDISQKIEGKNIQMDERVSTTGGKRILQICCIKSLAFGKS
jgi:hypothetical protein